MIHMKSFSPNENEPFLIAVFLPVSKFQNSDGSVCHCERVTFQKQPRHRNETEKR